MHVERDLALDDGIALLRRCRTVLGNMAEEREGVVNAMFGRRWPINHEPLRADARNLLPLIDEFLDATDL